MRSLRQFLIDNRPAAKPELWNDFPRIARRRALAWLNATIDPGWSKRPQITTLQADGLLLEVTPSDVVGKPIAYFGIYELAVTTLVRAYLRAGDTFVDVGANIGYYAAIAGHIVGPGGRVFAFEPSARIRGRLIRNMALNELTQVEVRSEAVSRVTGVVRLIEPDKGDNDGLAFVDPSMTSQGVDVRSVRLDDIAELKARPPNLLKVDVEGGEPDVFAGACSLFRHEDAPSILFESFDIERDAKQLRDQGYEVFQPTLSDGSIGLTGNLSSARYRRWEAPNYLAVKSARGHEFCARLTRP